MRMWMVDPVIMCRQHLLGEHRELHALRGCLEQGISLEGYLKYEVLELRSLWSRHDALVAEMLNRGYKHHSPLLEIDIPVHISEVDFLPGEVDSAKQRGILLERCQRCRARAKALIDGACTAEELKALEVANGSGMTA